ncbi:E3 ubiquitin-protein ligase znrf1 [Anabarilius grahami]|uniref:RING-type E3 ubiquitin transferase n=1 Tax=Anabarilius grahami TaxID=495550 RepID=A0A3N0Z9C8_ANAGA|nr:E3 ubiquitin-protein ligase znrf1 [Anabarilius grahami]
MGGKQSTAGRPRGAFPGVSTDDSAVPPSAHFGHYRPGGTMGLRSRSVSSVAGMGIDHSATVPFGFYTPRGTDSDRAGGGSGSDPAHNGNGYQETGGGHHTDGMLYLGSRASLADTLPLHIAPRWFSAHSGLKHHYWACQGLSRSALMPSSLSPSLLVKQAPNVASRGNLPDVNNLTHFFP